MALAIAACQSPAPKLPPRTRIAHITLHTTPATAELAHHLVTAYNTAHPGQRLLLRRLDASYAAILRTTAEAPPEDYALVEYLPPTVSLWAAPIGQMPLGIVTHPDVDVDTLNMVTLGAIFHGQITNWRGVDGANLPVRIASREAGSPLETALKDTLLDNQQIAPGARILNTDRALLDYVSATPGAIGYVLLPPGDSPPFVRVLALDDAPPGDPAYPLTLTLYITGPGEPDDPLYDFIAWLQSAEGQQTLTSLMWPLHPGE
ncbi:MAG: hypothetical protein Kow0077_06540 [Anaerolineae bacterium]